ncbi:MAG: Unknown protein [uncultured Sulfurovum sp.]|uniref:Integral membrane protein n=1 Tax=uncultured Sulfurovum sp. TaxID=269237 RepID=A0A6S6TCI8_9BACT|nr:MAG: Unknown protein [uncultured Sulfurovum sp.]
MVKRLSFFLLTIIVLISLYLSVFELLLYSFHSPLGNTIKNPTLQEATWTYLIHQKYMGFIELDTYTIYEKRHLLDVKKVFEKTYDLWIIFTLLSVVILLFFFKKIIKSVIALGISINILLIVFSLNFIKSFELFHNLFFKNNSWIFSNDSLLIQLFPLHYFQEFFILLLLLTFSIFILLYMYRYLNAKNSTLFTIT